MDNYPKLINQLTNYKYNEHKILYNLQNMHKAILYLYMDNHQISKNTWQSSHTLDALSLWMIYSLLVLYSGYYDTQIISTRIWDPYLKYCI